MELHLRIIGTLLSLLAFVHIIFPRYFNWKKELASLSLINRQMMQVHTIFIAFTVLLIGLLCLTSAHELVTTELGRRITLGLGVFWAVRFIFQLFVYSGELWKGKRFETTVHIAFTFFWLYMSAIFFGIYFELAV